MRRLIPFLHEHHADDNYIIWPDLATSYNANDTTALLHEKNIHFVPKSGNPPNVPQLRAIENFWDILKSKVYDGGLTAKAER